MEEEKDVELMYHEMIDKFEEDIEDVYEDKDFVKDHDKFAYNKVDAICPQCAKKTLEYQIMGWDKEIFCTNCDYHKTEQA